MTGTVPDWPAVLRALDEPGVLGQAAGLEFPRNFDRAATQERFDRLAVRLGEAYSHQLVAGPGPQQDAAYFGDVRIPAEATLTRAKRSRVGFAVGVRVSNFGSLATCLPLQDSPATQASTVPAVHPGDRSRIERVLEGLDYRFVPAEVLEAPYDGPNQWVFGPHGATWFTRFFGFL